MGLQFVQDEASMPIGTLSVWETTSLTFYLEKTATFSRCINNLWVKKRVTKRCLVLPKFETYPPPNLF
jgi:hypothetical protein